MKPFLRPYAYLFRPNVWGQIFKTNAFWNIFKGWLAKHQGQRILVWDWTWVSIVSPPSGGENYYINIGVVFLATLIQQLLRQQLCCFLYFSQNSYFSAYFTFAQTDFCCFLGTTHLCLCFRAGSFLRAKFSKGIDHGPSYILSTLWIIYGFRL